jgi:hypothetical protein
MEPVRCKEFMIMQDADRDFTNDSGFSCFQCRGAANVARLTKPSDNTSAKMPVLESGIRGWDDQQE